MDTLIEIFDESVVWHLPGRSSMANDYQGRDATLAYFGQMGQETGGTFQAELQHLLADDDDRVVGIQRSTADREGKHLDVGNCIVFQLKDGRVLTVGSTFTTSTLGTSSGRSPGASNGADRRRRRTPGGVRPVRTAASPRGCP